MLRIVVGGQINKQEIHKAIENFFKDEEIELAIKNDLDAVNLVKAGKFDYYIGACNTGGGGALAMAIALLGMDSCKTISMPGKISSDEEIKKAVDQGRIAFGFTAQHADSVLPVLLTAIKERNKEK